NYGWPNFRIVLEFDDWKACILYGLNKAFHCVYFCDDFGIYLRESYNIKLLMAIIIEKSTALSDTLLAIERKQCCKLESLHFSSPIEFIYNPLEYAYDLHSKFVHRFCNSPKIILFLGMNPGPWGMSQTGIPFGEIQVVKEWLKLSGTVGHPVKEHPSRQVLGLDCKRSEISGKKFWGFFQNLCGEPETFFQHSFVYNYCPFAFMTETGKNITPAELKISERQAINEICDEALCDVLRLLEVEIIIAIGRFAETRAAKAVKGTELEGKIKVMINHSNVAVFCIENFSLDENLTRPSTSNTTKQGGTSSRKDSTNS
ncbi:hypothetical protein C0J52_02685, partial [Blattella germanica]